MKLKISPYFSDGAVLQRDKNIRVRGIASPDFPVVISFFDKKHHDASDKNGDWEINLGCFLVCNNPLEMRVTSGEEEITVRDILIGDVWLCSGQSNMELTLDRVAHNYPDEMRVTDPLIRQLKIPQAYNFNGISELGECSWETFNPETATNFTAVGYFFAKKLRKRYGIPIGLLAAAVGGVPVAAYMSREMLRDFPEDLAEADKCADSAYVEKTIADYAAYERDYANRLNAADFGVNQKWYTQDYDDSDWEEADLCEPLTASGAYWFRKTVEIPSEMRGKRAALFFGTAIDMDEAYVNGEKVGVTYYRYPPREYPVALPDEPDGGKLSIAVRLQCFEGRGGFIKGKNYFLAAENRVIDLGGVWRRKVGAFFEDRKPQTFFIFKPTGLWGGMVAPLSDFAINGVIWYQGESDGGNSERYAEKMKILINKWREIWGQERLFPLPFLMTQLAYWGEEGDWNPLRGQQKRCLDLPNVGLAAAYDLGEENDLHPLNKRDVGERLARLAMRIAYGEKLPVNPYELYGPIQQCPPNNF